MSKKRYLRDSHGKFAGSLPTAPAPSASPVPSYAASATTSAGLTISYWEWDGTTGQPVTVDVSGKTIHDEDVQYIYRNGQCHSLAYHLHLQTGWPLAKLVITDHEEGLEDTVHFVVIDPDDPEYVYDIAGRRHVSEMYDDMAGTYEAELQSLTRESFRKEISNTDVWMPLDLSASAEFARQIVEDA